MGAQDAYGQVAMAVTQEFVWYGHRDAHEFLCRSHSGEFDSQLLGYMVFTDRRVDTPAVTSTSNNGTIPYSTTATVSQDPTLVYEAFAVAWIYAIADAPGSETGTHSSSATSSATWGDVQ